MIFLHISPDPKSRDDLIPVTPYWQIEDILLSAKYVLRRRNADEVKGRAKVILAKVREYEESLVGAVELSGKPFPMYPDDAELLQDIIMPDRAFPFSSPEKRPDIKFPVVIEEGWVAAEDLAILALLKIDEAIDALNDGTPEDLLVYSGLLLEAYRAQLLSERARGRDILTINEFDAYKQKYLEAKELRIKAQNSVAGKSKNKTIKAEILSGYRQMRRERPLEDWAILAKEIADEYLSKLPGLDFYAPKLSPTNARRTITGWIKCEGDLPIAGQEPLTSDKQTRQSLRKKRQF